MSPTCDIYIRALNPAIIATPILQKARPKFPNQSAIRLAPPRFAVIIANVMVCLREPSRRGSLARCGDSKHPTLTTCGNHGS
jgi:hypothetical protein